MATFYQMEVTEKLAEDGWVGIQFPFDMDSPIGGYGYFCNSAHEIIFVRADGSIGKMIEDIETNDWTEDVK